MVGEITSEILFEAHAAVFEHAVLEIASEMNVSLKAVELVHRHKLGFDVFHVLHFKTEHGKLHGILITEDEVANLPTWPPPSSTIHRIKSALSPVIQG